MKSFQILGVLLIDDVGEFQFVPTQSVPRIKVTTKQQPTLETETGIEEALNPTEFEMEEKRDKTPKNLDEQLNKYNKE